MLRRHGSGNCSRGIVLNDDRRDASAGQVSDGTVASRF